MLRLRTVRPAVAVARVGAAHYSGVARVAVAANALTRVRGATTSGSPRFAAPAMQAVRYYSADHDRRQRESVVSGTSAVYLEGLYRDWEENPSSVSPSWAAFFEQVNASAGFSGKPSLGDIDSSQESMRDSLRVMLLIRAYQVRGHEVARLDPLAGAPGALDMKSAPKELKIETYGFTESDLDRRMVVDVSVLSSMLPEDGLTLREYVARLQTAYCGVMGVEYMHMTTPEEIDWMRNKIEVTAQEPLSSTERVNLLDRLTWADQFEKYLALKFKSVKRFGLDGGEVLIPGLKTLIDTSADLGVDSIVIGMPHRGRMNVLANVVRKPLPQILADFDHHDDKGDSFKVDEVAGSGDVKYHLGTSYDRLTRSGKKVHLSLVANPSHLETVDPVALGKARAKMHGRKDRNSVMGLLIHGDAAFAGQGVVFETFHLSKLPHFTTGGTVHVVVNNQIGFTTDPEDGRADKHCTDAAKVIGAPVLHVNGDHPEAVIRCMKIASEYRQKFGKDVVVDIVCYRRFGHNEIDQPMFTQPLIYQRIAKHPTTLSQYKDKLVKEGVVTDIQSSDMVQKVTQAMSDALAKAAHVVVKKSDWLDSKWEGFKALPHPEATAITDKQVKEIGAALTTLPAGFNINTNLGKNFIGKQKTMFETGKGFDWGTAEALAIGSLLQEGIHVRLSGQDCERGTFSHRHAVLHDMKTDARHTPLNHVANAKESFLPLNSPLDEYAVLGYELGYSMESADNLVMWEAQFGDFANGAQVVIDQFISSGEQKWLRQAGLVCLLPHGYDGLGPEHSSARLERFLLMVDQDWDKVIDEKTALRETNWQVCNITTPANYFHALRRQIHRDFRKPLIIMSPKFLLRYEKAISSQTDFTGTSAFQPVLGEANSAINPSKVRKTILCSGQVYYDLIKARDDAKKDDVAIVRVEQLAPFPSNKVIEQLAKYPKAEVVWCQEEHKNMGAWNYAYFHLKTALRHMKHTVSTPKYVGRGPSAPTAVGHAPQSQEQKVKFLKEALA